MKKIMAILLVIVLVFGSFYNNHNVTAEQKTQEQNQEECTVQATVKDTSGVKRKLKIDYVQNVGTVIDNINIVSDYSQVIDGHYYYMRQMKRNYFSVYQDAGEKIGSFKITDFDVYDECLDRISKCGEQFYLIVKNYWKEIMEIAVVDFDEQKVKNCKLLFFQKRKKSNI